MSKTTQIKPEIYQGGIVLREFIDPTVAQKYGKLALDLMNTKGNTSFYNVMFRRYQNSTPLLLPYVKKAWISREDENFTVSKISEDTSFSHAQTSSIESLANDIDERTDSASTDRSLIIYQPRAVLLPHQDIGLSSRLVNLTGVGDFKWHNEKNQVFERVELHPGDLLWTDDETTHSVQAVSETPRVTLALIDSETKNRDFLSTVSL